MDNSEAQAILEEYYGPRYEIASARTMVVNLVIFVIHEKV